MTHFGYDMDHDGEITSKDTGIFHEMMDEDERTSESNFPILCTNGYSREEFWIRLAIIYACGGFAGMVLNGTIPINFFTGVLGIICAIASLLLTLDLFGVAL